MMKINESLLGRRGELLAELFLQELNPIFVSRTEGADFGIDFFVGMKNERHGINVVAVEVKSTEREVKGRFVVSKRTYDILLNSNVLGLLLVANVKTNQLYFHLARTPVSHLGSDVRLPVVEVNASEKARLLEALIK